MVSVDRAKEFGTILRKGNHLRAKGQRDETVLVVVVGEKRYVHEPASSQASFQGDDLLDCQFTTRKDKMLYRSAAERSSC